MVAYVGFLIIGLPVLVWLKRRSLLTVGRFIVYAAVAAGVLLAIGLVPIMLTPDGSPPSAGELLRRTCLVASIGAAAGASIAATFWFLAGLGRGDADEA